MRQLKINACTLELTQGDIADQKVDAIVNAANSGLVGGGGVDGAIHRRGGPSIMQETRQRYPDGCPTGSAVISGAGNLDAKYIIHAVGPVWNDGTRGEADQLRLAYATCLKLAVEHDCDSVAFPSLSTGAYRYPISDASRVALTTTINFLRDHSSLRLVRFVLFDDAARREFSQTLADIGDSNQ